MYGTLFLVVSMLLWLFIVLILNKNTMRYPKNNINGCITINNIKKSTNFAHDFVFINNNGIWEYSYGECKISIDLQGYLFPKAFIRAYVVRNLRYCNCKSLYEFLKLKLLIKKYKKYDIYIVFREGKQNKKLLISKQGKTMNSILSQFITKSRYYLRFMFIKSIISLKDIPADINEKKYLAHKGL